MQRIKDKSPNMLRVVLLGIAAWLSTGTVPAQPVPVLHSNQFSADPAFTAKPSQVVVLDAPADGQTLSVVRYTVDEPGSHNFCMRGDTKIAQFQVLDLQTNEPLLRGAGVSSPSCTSLNVGAGVYQVSVVRGAMGDPLRVSYVVLDPLPVSLLDATGAAVGGLWVIQPDPEIDPDHHDAVLRAKLLDGSSPGEYAIGDYFDTHVGPDAYFRFQYDAAQNLPLLGGGRYLGRLWVVPSNLINASGGDLLGVTKYTCAQFDANTVPVNGHGIYPEIPFCPSFGFIRVVEQGDLFFTLTIIDRNGHSTDYYRTGAGGPDVFYPVLESTDYILNSIYRLRLVYRYFPDGQTGPLRDGEVALYSQCNYQGPAVVVSGEFADLLKWSGMEDLSRFGFSVRLGNNTGITLYDQAVFAGRAQTSMLDTPCVAAPLHVASLQVYPLRAAFLATGQCPKCRMQGVNLAGKTVVNADLSGAQLNQANLSQATLQRANLQGADLSFAQLQGASLDNANLAGATLYHAFLTNNVNGNITQAASLKQAHLKNVNLAFAELTGANFSDANFYGDAAAAGLACTTTGANLQGFTNGCATAQSAVMTETTFEGAYLFGVDFSNSESKGVTFDKSTLVGANFSGATFETNSVTARKTTMYRALLQGTDLSTARFTDVDLTGAQVDFRGGGNNLFVYLDGKSHNQFACFPNCQPAQGQDVCVEVNYPQPTAVSATATPTCPDGAAGPCGPADAAGGNTRWKSSVTPDAPPSGLPPVWYDLDATWASAPANRGAICQGKGESSAIIYW